MSKTTLALKLADKAGTTVDDAMQFVDDVGEQTAAKLLDGDSGKLAEKAKKAGFVTAAGGTAIGGYDLGKTYLQTQQEQSDASIVADIMNDDSLSAEEKRKLVEEAFVEDDESNSGGGPFNLGGGGLFSNPAVLLVLIIVVAIVLSQTLGDS